MLETGDHNKIRAHTPLGFVEFQTDADVNLFKRALANRVLDSVSHAVFASPHSIVAKSLVAQCVIAFLEDFAPKDYSLAKLLDHVSASKIPAVMPIILKVALHFRSDGLLSGRDPVLWAERIREPAFREMATQQPATAELLGLNPEIKTTGVALFKEVWNTSAWRENDTPAPEGVEHSISKRINFAIKERCIKKVVARIKPRVAQTLIKPDSKTEPPRVVTKPKPAPLRLPPVQAAGIPKLPPKPKAPTKPKAPPAQPTPKPTQEPKPRPQPDKPYNPPPAAAATVTPPNPGANQTPMIVQTSKASEAQAPKPTEPPPISTPVIERAPTNASGNAQEPPLPERPPRLNRDQVFDLLMNARQQDWVELSLEDGRSLSGAILFNEFKGTGRLINVDEEFTYDFNVDQVLNVKC